MVTPRDLGYSATKLERLQPVLLRRLEIDRPYSFDNGDRGTSKYVILAGNLGRLI